MPEENMPQVAVCGDGSPHSPHLDAARRAGELVAAAGAVLLTGGLGGVMEAAADGARAAGGLVVSILPGASAARGTAGAQVRVATGAGEGRNVILVRSAAAVVAIGGGYGTLSEIALAKKMGIPVFGYQTWKAAHPGDGSDLLIACDTVDEAVGLALQAAAKGG
jgi:uncharacterized protein (TIGR00725 family)